MFFWATSFLRPTLTECKNPVHYILEANIDIFPSLHVVDNFSFFADAASEPQYLICN